MKLYPMTPEDLDSYRAKSVGEYAADHVKAGNWTKDEAEARAAQEYDELLPDGLDTPGMLLFTATDETGHHVGMLWLGLTHPRGVPDTGWIYDIEISAHLRRHGHGRALLAAAEHVLAEHDVGTLAFNVFGDNAAARALYESAGYEVTTLQMRKQLR